MNHKMLEIRDEGTAIHCMAVRPDLETEPNRYFWGRCGYRESNILLCQLDGPRTEYDPFKWGYGRTMRIAHQYIQQHYDDIENGSVVDVQYILGETSQPKKSQRLPG